MLVSRTARRTIRRGITAVEAALVMAVFLMLLFGVFEYCRFLLVLHFTLIAALDGACYAVVNLDKPANFDTTDYTDATGKVYPAINKYTKQHMGGVEKNIDGFKVATFAVDQSGLDQTPPVIRPKTKN